MRRLLIAVLVALPIRLQAIGKPAACKSSYDPTYNAAFAMDHASWSEYCDDDFAIGDIVAVGVERCAQRYDEIQALPIGVTREAWLEACKNKLNGLTPAAYLAAKRKQFALEKPVAEIPIGVAELFVAETASDGAPDVREKRTQLMALLGKAREVRQRFGGAIAASVWNSQPLSISAVASEDDFGRWRQRFDLSGALSGGTEANSNAVSAQGGNGNANDNRPVRVSQSMGGVDRGLDRPAAVKQRLLDRVAALGQPDAHGVAQYGPRVVALMREVVQSVPVDEGPLHRTDEVALDDARRMVEAIERNHPEIVFSRDIEGDGLTRAARDRRGELIRLPDGTYRKSVTIKPGPKGSTSEYSEEQLAGTFLHEVGAHVYRDATGGGTNGRVNEGNAFLMEFRYYANKRQDMTEQLEAEQSILDQPRLTPSERHRHEARINELARRRASFIDEANMGLLAKFIGRPGVFQRNVLFYYYGGKEMPRGRLTVAQQRERALRGKTEADRDHDLTNQVKFELELGWLEKDAALQRDMATRDARWRMQKAAECRAWLAADRWTQENRAMLAELNRAETVAAAAGRREIAEKKRRLESAYQQSLERYDACRVRNDL